MNYKRKAMAYKKNFVLRHSWNDWIILQNEHFFSKTPKSWFIIWKREKIISYRNNLISWNQFYEKYREINFILEVVFIKLISGKKSWNQFSIQFYLITLLFQNELVITLTKMWWHIRLCHFHKILAFVTPGTIG